MKQFDRPTWQQVPEAGAVVLPDAVEHHGPGGHVHAHGERLGGKQHLGGGGMDGRRQHVGFHHQATDKTCRFVIVSL